jgi:tRNA modification GTPase
MPSGDLSYFVTDTIFAPASSGGRQAITVVRISGPKARAHLAALIGTIPPPRRASLRTLRSEISEVLDRALVLWMPAPHSYTGEDGFELHLHGGLSVLAGVTDQFIRWGLRPAEPGEFTRRAFLHGRMDLLEAEAVADLIESETSDQRAQALQQLSGELGDVYRGWSAQLLRILAQQEALIDFPEEDLPPEVEEGLLQDMAALQAAFEQHLSDGGRGERLRSGLVFAIAGSPNVGKSALMNALCRRDIAIVSPTPGTTRDVIEARLDLGGVPVTLLDLAGLRMTDDPIEAEGVRRARDRIQTADLILLVVDPPYKLAGLDADTFTAERIVVASKCDLGAVAPDTMVAVSAMTGEGIEHLLQTLQRAAQRMAGRSAAPGLTRSRHRAAVQAAATHLSAGRVTSEVELRGEELRLALRCLGRVTGTVGVEEILDSVFSQFCIGK